MLRSHAIRLLTLATASSLFGLLGGCSKGLGSDFQGSVTMHTSSAAGSSQDMVLKTKGGKIRFDTKAPNGEAMHGIFDPAASKVVFCLDSQKAYMDMDFGKPSAAPNTDPGTSSIEKTGKTETIAGTSCEDWVVHDPSGKHSEVCIAEGIAYFDLSSLKPGAGGAPTSAMAKQFKDKKSFPLRAVEFDAAGKELSRMEVTKIEKEKLDDALFVVPADYKKFEPPAAPH